MNTLEKPPEVQKGASIPANAASTSVAERIFVVLLAFDAHNRSLTLSAISRRTNLPVATVHRLLRKLEGIGAVERNDDGAYSVGPLMWRTGILARSHDVIGYGARPLLMALSARAESDVKVFSYFEEAAMCIDEVHLGSMSAQNGLGEMHPLDNHAGGIALAAQLDSETLGRHRLTRRGLQALEKNVAKMRERHYAFFESATIAEFAVPLDVRDRPPMSLAIRYAKSTDSPAQQDRNKIAALHATARSLSALLNERRR